MTFMNEAESRRLVPGLCLRMLYDKNTPQACVTSFR
jgi:hypothetical protein